MRRSLSLVVISLFFIGCTQPNPFAFKTGEFAHTVLIWLENPEKEEDRVAFEQALEKFLNNSQYAQRSFYGTAAQTPREVVDNSYTYCLVVFFEDKNMHDRYQEEEAHKIFIEEASHLWKEVKIYDSLHP